MIMFASISIVHVSLIMNSATSALGLRFGCPGQAMGTFSPRRLKWRRALRECVSTGACVCARALTIDSVAALIDECTFLWIPANCIPLQLFAASREGNINDLQQPTVEMKQAIAACSAVRHSIAHLKQVEARATSNN